MVTGSFVSPRSQRIGRSVLVAIEFSVFGFASVMLSIKLIDMTIGHDRSVGGCFSKRVRIYRISNHQGGLAHLPVNPFVDI